MNVRCINEHISDVTYSFIDGISVDYVDVWFNIIQSNTEPILRIRVEGMTKEFVNTMKENSLLV